VARGHFRAKRTLCPAATLLLLSTALSPQFRLTARELPKTSSDIGLPLVSVFKARIPTFTQETETSNSVPAFQFVNALLATSGMTSSISSFKSEPSNFSTPIHSIEYLVWIRK
jgi:hypothetical protein